MTDLPQSLVDALQADSRVVKSLPPAGRRVIWSLLIAALVFAAGIFLLGLRSDLRSIPVWLGWGASGLEFALAALLIFMAFRESVPGQAVPGGMVWSLLSSAVLFQLAVGYLTWRFSPGISDAGRPLTMGMQCMVSEISMCIPTFILTIYLVLRAWPLRAWMAGLLGGVGAAIATDTITHLHCPISSFQHVLVWHSGAVILFGAGGALLGSVLAGLRDLGLTQK